MRVLLTLYWNIYAGRLNVVSQTEAQSLDDTVFAAERANVKKLSGSEHKEVFQVARKQLFGQREAESAKQARAEEGHAAEFTWRKHKPFRR